MKENMITVTSNSDATLVMKIDDLHLNRVWPKRGAKFVIERDKMEEAFYDPAIEYLFKHGMLITDDKEFLMDVGLIDEETSEMKVLITDDKLYARMIKVMPIAEFKETIGKMSPEQIIELAEYAIEHYQNLGMDRADLLSKASGRNIMKAIELAKADQEG